MPDKNVSHNNQKKIAAINDYSGFGRCSIAVELPVISAMKIQCCPMPTSIFSNHTGFDSFYFNVVSSSSNGTPSVRGISISIALSMHFFINVDAFLTDS